MVTEDILRRMRALGAIAVPFGSYVHRHGGNLVAWYGTERVKRMFAHRWFRDAGVAVAGSSEFPCGPFEPLLAMHSCVTRTGWDGTPASTVAAQTHDARILRCTRRLAPAQDDTAFPTGKHLLTLA